MSDSGQVTLLPAQLRHLAQIAVLSGSSVTLTQDGNILHVDTGHRVFDMNEYGRTITNPDQRTLDIAEEEHHI
jgi:hypothetical protein